MPTFEPKKVEFAWADDQWALTYLPPIRLAIALLEQSEVEMTEKLKQMIETGTSLSDLREGLFETREHCKRFSDPTALTA